MTARYRVIHDGDTSPAFYTLTGALTYAAIRYERDPRTARPVVEYLEGDEWHPLGYPGSLSLDPSRIPDGTRPLTETERRALGLGPRRAPLPD